MTSSFINSQATDSVAPRWLKGAGHGYSECSKCHEKVASRCRRAHEETCWTVVNEEPIKVTSLCISEEYSSESYSSSSLSMSDSIFFEYSNIEKPSLEMNNSIVFSSDIEEVEEKSKRLEFSHTTEDVSSFVCTIDQIGTNKYSGLKPYTVNFSTEDSDAAIKWFKDIIKNCGEFDVKDKPTGEYVKACFTIDYDKVLNNYEEMRGILIHDVLTALQLYGVDISSVNYIIDTYDYKNSLGYESSKIYMLLPEYCMENTDNLFRYRHEIHTEYDLIGFVRKGTPIIPKDICDLIDDFIHTEKRFECGELLIRKFLNANKEKLINGETFTLKDMEDAGIIDIYKSIYPLDKRNIKFGKDIGKYCYQPESKANHKIASNQRRKYKLKNDMIKSLL